MGKSIPTQLKRLNKLKSELNQIKSQYKTEYDNHDPYWRGVRVGLEVSIAVLQDSLYE